jgi:hypothetical protein
MSEDLDALLREHYRRAAETMVPDPDVVDRARAAGRTRPSPARTWPRLLAAAAAIAAIAMVTWGLLRPIHRSERPATPPRPAVDLTPAPTRTPVPVPRPSHRRQVVPGVRPQPSAPEARRLRPDRRTAAPGRSTPGP